MVSTDDLMREASGLAEEIRQWRVEHQSQYFRDANGIRLLESRMAAVWASIRASRATTADATAIDFSQRRRPKWE